MLKKIVVCIYLNIFSYITTVYLAEFVICFADLI